MPGDRIILLRHSGSQHAVLYHELLSVAVTATLTIVALMVTGSELGGGAFRFLAALQR